VGGMKEKRMEKELIIMQAEILMLENFRMERKMEKVLILGPQAKNIKENGKMI